MKPSSIIIILTLGLLFTTGPAALADDETNSSNGLDFNSFKIVSERNIFNPNRFPSRGSRTQTRAVKVDSFTLLGTMSYEKGRFAFFDGSSYEYHKTLKPADTIAGYRIAEVGSYGVKLLAASNQVINLSIGMQMRRMDGGPWGLLSHAEPIASNSGSGSNGSGTPAQIPSDVAAKAATMSGADGDALKRLMMRRLKEQ